MCHFRLRKEHATAVGEEGRWMGVDVMNEGPVNILPYSTALRDAYMHA